ncbi:hypothetical protein F8M41_015076 [Gigaspora margarita]|uniref:Uncharacterized protein n=1 Tax=Gigaspora margarita TaxID=4874 RepID=A0A8H3WVW6_GIGMA|nr:hypothetical protein F8M41_015076 [Gigaspora margarita]
MKIAYEKTLFLWIFFQKKQYGGCLHEHFVKLVDAVLFLKGVKQIVFDTLSNYISQQCDLELFVLNVKYDPSKKPVSVKDFFNSKHVERTSSNKMVIDFVAKRNGKGKKNLEPGRFYYYVLTHQDPKVSIGKKMRLVSEFIETDVIDKLYYFKSLKDICASFLACTAKEAEKQIESFYREQTDSFKQLTLDFNPSSSLKKKNSTDPILITKKTKLTVVQKMKKAAGQKQKENVQLN